MDSQTKKKKYVQEDTLTNSVNSVNPRQKQESPLTCLGCEQGILNQLGHMDEGGCLYDPDY